MIFELVDIVSEYLYFRYGYVGFPASDVPAHDPAPALLWEYIMEIFYNPILALVKTSVLGFLLRISSHNKNIRLAIYVVNFVNLAQMVALVIVVIFQTSPIEAAWNPNVEALYSVDFVQFAVASGAITIATDVLVLAIPICVFIGLNMRTAQKIGLIVLFLAGGVVTTVSCIRLAIMQKSFTDPAFNFNNSWGPTCAGIETNLAIVTACVPALRPLLVKWLPQYFKGKTTQDGPSCGASERLGRNAGTNRHKNPGGSGFVLKELNQAHAQIRGYSPDGSEEEIMTYNGIIRTTNPAYEGWT
ncbi:hypothetical protein TruAng_002523 [Truncatella angustata]|nr:hypothetical protein TruAng_002523 [Truncatella angustata]